MWKAGWGIGLLLLVTAAGVAAALLRFDVSGPVWVGLSIGCGLGAVNLLVEYLSLGWVLKHKPRATQVVLLGGFATRLFLVCVLMAVFAWTGSVNVVSFALSYVLSFPVFVVFGFLIRRMFRTTGSEASPPSEGGCEV